eukprot:PhF_6_TR92/c0_g1_i1/m.64
MFTFMIVLGRHMGRSPPEDFGGRTRDVSVLPGGGVLPYFVSECLDEVEGFWDAKVRALISSGPGASLDKCIRAWRISVFDGVSSRMPLRGHHWRQCSCRVPRLRFA